MNKAELDELARAMRSIRWNVEYGQHELLGLGAQNILQGAGAVDFRPGNDGRGRWRLIYDVQANGRVLLHGIIDYHGGGRYAPAWGVGYNIDLA